MKVELEVDGRHSGQALEVARDDLQRDQLVLLLRNDILYSAPREEVVLDYGRAKGTWVENLNEMNLMLTRFVKWTLCLTAHDVHPIHSLQRRL